jgi:hypothetical protein
LGGPYHPRATLYRFPDGRLLWCLRLWEVDHVERRCASTEELRQFARVNRLPAVRAAIDLLAEQALVEGR